MRTAGEFAGFEEAWRDFLGSIEKCWAKVEQGCQGFRSPYQPWAGSFSQIRKKDPLLRYLKHARNADQHTIQEIVAHHRGGWTSFIPASDKPIQIDRMVVEDGRLMEYRGSEPLHFRIYPDRVELLRVKDRGEWYNPPMQHLDQPLQSNSPLAVAELGLRFYEDFVVRTEAKFFPPT
jgi:hypothetical protein